MNITKRNIITILTIILILLLITTLYLLIIGQLHTSTNENFIITITPTPTPTPTPSTTPMSTPMPTLTPSTTTATPTPTPTPMPTPTPSTTAPSCISYMFDTSGDVENACNSASQCYYVSGNCLDKTLSGDISKIKISCAYRPNNNGGYTLNCYNTNTNDSNYYLIDRIKYTDKFGNQNLMYPYSTQIKNKNNDIIVLSNVPTNDIYASNNHNMITLYDINGNMNTVIPITTTVDVSSNQKLVIPAQNLANQSEMLLENTNQNLQNIP